MKQSTNCSLSFPVKTGSCCCLSCEGLENSILEKDPKILWLIRYQRLKLELIFFYSKPEVNNSVFEIITGYQVACTQFTGNCLTIYQSRWVSERVRSTDRILSINFLNSQSKLTSSVFLSNPWIAVMSGHQ